MMTSPSNPIRDLLTSLTLIGLEHMALDRIMNLLQLQIEPPIVRPPQFLEKHHRWVPGQSELTHQKFF